MADFSIGDALGSGFGLMGKRPISVMAWGLTYLILGMALPVWIALSVLGPDFFSMFKTWHPGMSPAEVRNVMLPMHGKMMLFQPIMFVTTLAAQAILMGAVFRATLEPRNRGLLYLRIGPRELWLALLSFVIRILAGILLVVMALAGLAIGFGLNLVFEGQHVDWVARNCAFVALGLLDLAIFIGICVRFSLAAPMTFAESNFRLFESWGLTRRHGWKLFALGFLVAVVSVVVVLAFEAVVFGVILLGVGGLHLDQATFQGFMQDPNKLWSSGVGEGAIVVALVAAYAFGGVFAVSLAPWAVAYRELLPRAPAPPAGGLFDAPAPAPVAPPADHGHGHDDHGHAAPAHDDHGHAAPAHDDHGHDDHGHGDHGHAAPAHDDHGHADPHAAHGDDHGHGDHGHDDHGHDAHGHDDHGAAHDDHGHDAHGHDDHGHGGDAHGHDDHGHGEAHGHDDHGHDDGHGHDDHGHGGHH
jgi:hypothetical protein